MRSWIALLGLLAACGFSSSQSGDAGRDDGDGGTGDGPPDAPQLCYGTFPRVCFNTAADVPSGPLQFSSPLFEILTSNFDVCDADNDRAGEFCVIAGAGFTLPANTTIRAFGTKPLVLLSTKEMVLHGNVDVSSNRGAAATNVGAGGNSASCPAVTTVEVASGGYGGSFQGPGGDGGRAGTSNTPTAPPGLGTSFPSPLRGGCRGANGALAGLSTGGVGGNGGGAVSVIGTSITIDGRINASGGGGGGGVSAVQNGGGGGGSGGMIVLDTSTPIVPGTGILYANGGGGGEGGVGGGNPAPGADGKESTGPTDAAAGGNGNDDGGNGGAGSAGGTFGGGGPPTQAQGQGGGGGGGGAAGFIHAPGFSGNAIAPRSLDLPPGVAP